MLTNFNGIKMMVIKDYNGFKEQLQKITEINYFYFSGQVIEKLDYFQLI